MHSHIETASAQVILADELVYAAFYKYVAICPDRDVMFRQVPMRANLYDSLLLDFA